MPKKPLEVKPDDVVAVYWQDHAAYRSVPKIAGAFNLVNLCTFGKVLSLDPEKQKIELVQEEQMDDVGEANDACALGTGMVTKIVVYRPVGEVVLDY